MTLFVTGATGFIGGHFTKLALAGGHRVTALRRTGSETRVPLTPPPNWIEGGLGDDFSTNLLKCDALVHFAAAGVSPQKSSWDELFRVNVCESIHLWNRAATEGVKRFVICGSCFEYGASATAYEAIPAAAPLQPTGAYAASKAAATMGAVAFSRERNVQVIILRPFHVYGEGQHSTNFWPSLRRAALAGDDFAMTKGEQKRDFTPVKTVATEFLRAAQDPTLEDGNPRIVNVGSGEPQTLRQFAQACWREWNAAGRLMFGALPYRPNEVMQYVPALARHG